MLLRPFAQYLRYFHGSDINNWEIARYRRYLDQDEPFSYVDVETALTLVRGKVCYSSTAVCGVVWQRLRYKRRRDAVMFCSLVILLARRTLITSSF